MMRGLRTPFFALLLTLGGLPCACSGSNTSGVSQQQFPQEFAAAYCATIAPCCNAANIPYTAATCESNVRLIGSQFIGEGVTAKLNYDPAAAQACVNEVRTALQNCGSVNHVSCPGVFIGQTPTGGACVKSIECANGGTCNNAKCAPQPSDLPRGAAGEMCSGSCRVEGNNTSCDSSSSPGKICYSTDGLYCDFTTSKCTPFAQLGEPCGAGGCVTGTYCAAGSCVAGKPAGATCDSSEECVSGRCSGDVQPSTCAADTAATPNACQGMP